jgi:hypothetical protein
MIANSLLCGGHYEIAVRAALNHHSAAHHYEGFRRDASFNAGSTVVLSRGRYS